MTTIILVETERKMVFSICIIALYVAHQLGLLKTKLIEDNKQNKIMISRRKSLFETNQIAGKGIDD